MHIMVIEGKSHVLYGVKKACYEKVDNTYCMYLVLETGKTIEIDFSDEAEMEYIFSSLYNYGKANLCNKSYKVIE